tara:strand:- start:40 stop:642 length:603 start_codon:yes stop_codon:yes gene_type:complete
MIDFKVLESCIVSVGKTPSKYLAYLSANGQGIYKFTNQHTERGPLTHYEVLQRGVSKYIENKSKKEKSEVIRYLFGEDYKPKYEKYFSRSWQKLHSPYDVGFIQLPTEARGPIQTTILKKMRLVRITNEYKGLNNYNWRGERSINVESFHSLTRPQRRFILDYMESYHIPPDKIYIDDWTEKQLIKRQLGLQYMMGELNV